MSENKIQPYGGGRGKLSTFMDIKLDTLETSRETFAKAIEKYGKGEISENMGRALTYMLGHYLQYWKLIADLRIEERLDRIEERLDEKGIH